LNSKPSPNIEESLPVIIAGDEAFLSERDLLHPCPGISARNYEDKEICNFRAVENTFGIFTQKVGYFMAELILVLKTPVTLIFTA
jgi:hypothetical protein